MSGEDQGERPPQAILRGALATELHCTCQVRRAAWCARYSLPRRSRNVQLYVTAANGQALQIKTKSN